MAERHTRFRFGRVGRGLQPTWELSAQNLRALLLAAEEGVIMLHGVPRKAAEMAMRQLWVLVRGETQSVAERDPFAKLFVLTAEHVDALEKHPDDMSVHEAALYSEAVAALRAFVADDDTEPTNA